MEKWVKTTFWCLIVAVVIFYIGILIGLRWQGAIFVDIFIVLMIILDTATRDMKKKWIGFLIRLGILYVVVIILLVIFNTPSLEGLGGLLGIILLVEFITTLFKRKKKK